MIKLFTLNAHSLCEDSPKDAIDTLTDLLISENPDVIVLEEANQIASSPPINPPSNCLIADGAPDIPFKEGNFALSVFSRLDKYHLVWLPVKLGYERLDEGLALITKEKPIAPRGFYVSRSRDYKNWKTRMALCAYLQKLNFAVAATHLGKYGDIDEPFDEQWKNLRNGTVGFDKLFLIGDFNSPSTTRGEGYDTIIGDGFTDLFSLSSHSFEIPSVAGNIDGWENGLEGGRRIDFIFSRKTPSASKVVYRSVLDGVRGKRVSDHFGIIVELY